MSNQFVNSMYGDYGLLGGHGYFPSVANAGVPFGVPLGNVIGGATSGALAGDCIIIAEGKFEYQPGVNGIPGAPWVLYDTGVLVVREGYINWSTDDMRAWQPSPWFDCGANIYKIVFRGQIIAGSSLNALNLFISK